MGTQKLDEIQLLTQHLVPLFGRTPHAIREIGTSTVQIAHGVEAFDDCAVINVGDTAIVVGTDFIRGTGFSLFSKRILTYKDLGYFLAVANISDVAAMGAEPFALLTVIRYSEDMTEEEFASIIEGINDASLEYGTPVIGGDTGGAEKSVLCATALGFCPKDKCLMRNRAAPEQHLCITGSVGRAFAARVYFEYARPKGLQLAPELENQLIQAWKKPTARVAESLILRKYARACQDVSDGLKATVEQLAGQSGLGAEVYESMIPIDEATKAVAAYCGIRPAQLAMSASVDFELLCTVPSTKLKIMQQEFSEADRKITIIGKTTQQQEIRLICEDGSILSPLPGVAWKSQFGNIVDEVVRS